MPLDSPGSCGHCGNMLHVVWLWKKWTFLLVGRIHSYLFTPYFQLTPDERDNLHLVYYPSEVCHTLTSSNANLYYLSGLCGRCLLYTSDAADE